MARHSAVARRAAAAAGALIVAAVVVRLTTLPLPASLRAGEIALSGVAVVFTVLTLRARGNEWARRDLAVVASSVVAAAIAGGMLALAGGYLAGVDVYAVLLVAAILVSPPPRARARALLLATVLVDAVLSALWLSWAGHDVAGLAVVIVLVTALQLVAIAQVSASRATADSASSRSAAYAATAERVGTAIDVTGVTRAILEAARDSFPLTTHAAVFLYDSTADRLRPLPVYLRPGGVGTLESDNLDFTLSPGEGLAGRVFASNRPMTWPTAYDVDVARANLGEQVRLQVLELRRGVPLSAAGAPLVIDDEVIGVFVLTSHRQELVWGEQDMTVVTALADEAARAIERARRYERELDQAHLDSITGLANHRQLTRTLDQEVARSRRRSTSLGVVFCDLDRFKAVNDTYGHAAGDRVLNILAHVFHASLRREDSAARYGGDEFVCVLPGADDAEAHAVGRRIATSFEARVAEDPELATAGVTISCGVAIFPEDGGDVASLLQHADAAMRVVKMGRRAASPGSARSA